MTNEYSDIKKLGLCQYKHGLHSMQGHEIHGNYATPETKYAHVTEYFTGSTFPPLRRPLTLRF